MKIQVQKVQWTLWQTCEENGDYEIEIPDYMEDLILSVESSYGDLIVMIEKLVQSQHGNSKVV